MDKVCCIVTVLGFLLLCLDSYGAVQLDDCQTDGYVYITDDTTSTSTIRCSGVPVTDIVTWIITKNGQNNTVATCPGEACTGVNENVEVVRFVNSGYSALGITNNHQQVAGSDAVVTCQTSSGSRASCTIRIINKLPSIYILVAGGQPLYAGDKADLRCKTSPPSLPVTYTWTSRTGGPLNCDTSVTDKSMCQFYLTPQHNKEAVVCDLSYRDYRNIPGKSSNIVLNVRYPPPQPPVITGNREVSVGESLTLECRVYSGNPLVASVIFFCGQQYGDGPDTTVPSSTDDTSYVSSNVTIQSAKASDNGSTCECRGNWERPGLYTNKSSVTLTVSGTGTAQPHVTSVVTAQLPVTTTRSNGNTDSSLITPSTTTVNPAITPLKSTVTDAEVVTATAVASDNINIPAIAGGVVAAGVVCGVIGAVIAIAVQRYLRNRNYARPGPRMEESNYTDLTVYEQVGNTTNNTTSYANVGSSPVLASGSDENYYNTRGLGDSNPENHTYHNEALAADNTGTYEGLQLSEVGLQNTYTQLAKTKK